MLIRFFLQSLVSVVKSCKSLEFIVNEPLLSQDDDSGDESRKRRREDEGGVFQCNQCDKSFNKQSSLARHKYEHSGKVTVCFFHFLKIF